MSADDVMSEIVGKVDESLRTAAKWSVALGVVTKEKFIEWAAEEFDRAQTQANRPAVAVVPPGFEQVVRDTVLVITKSLTRQPCTHGCSLYRRYDEEHDAYDFLWGCGLTSRLSAAVFEVPRL